MSSSFIGKRCLLAAGMCVVLTLPASACQDVEIDPLAIAVAPETHGAVLLSRHLPSVPHLLTQSGLAAEGAAEADAWWESWTLREAAGAELRTSIYPAAARRLFPVLGPAGTEDLLTRHELSLSAAEGVGALEESEILRQALVRARGLHSEAWAAFQEGEGEWALGLVLQSVDALWEVSPRQVAFELVRRAEDALGRIQSPDSYSEEEMIRIKRLTSGASEALREGDYPRAIRRAYYACQILGVYPT